MAALLVAEVPEWGEGDRWNQSLMSQALHHLSDASLSFIPRASTALRKRVDTHCHLLTPVPQRPPPSGTTQPD